MTTSHGTYALAEMAILCQDLSMSCESHFFEAFETQPAGGECQLLNNCRQPFLAG
jgi:hypothetical protein